MGSVIREPLGVFPCRPPIASVPSLARRQPIAAHGARNAGGVGPFIAIKNATMAARSSSLKVTPS